MSFRKMPIKNAFLLCVFATYYCHGAVLLWSNRKVQISPLREFNDESLEELIEDLGYPKVTLYKSHTSLLPQFKQFLTGYYTTYNPNGEISTENATEISGIEDLRQHLDHKKPEHNVLSILVTPTIRSKREVTVSNTTETPGVRAYRTPTGHVFYKGKYVVKGDEDLYGLLYSSKPIFLKTTNNSFFLGNTAPDMVQLDTVKDSYTRLNVKIHVEEGNTIILRFIYTWSYDAYWSLRSVRIVDTEKKYNFELNITQKVSAPKYFSYHCSGETLFTDNNGTAELYLYDLQTQIDSKTGNFSDAYDCVDFVSAPILSGLFVSAILGIGLIIALIAISDIKTMDKFDNYKTKQLVVTVAE